MTAQTYTALRAALLSLPLWLTGCLFSETGTEYQQPDAHTSPVINLNYNATYALNTYVTFAENSADIYATFGSQTVHFPQRSEMRLQPFGGFDYKLVWKTSVLEDSRGIKTLRLGYFSVTNDTSDVGAPDFHSLARDTRGNIYLTEALQQYKSDLDTAPDYRYSDVMLFPANAAVGDTWVSGASLVPFFYEFGSGAGWSTTLVDDNATAPISGLTGCVLLKYYRMTNAYYVYLKDGMGVVEWLNSWEKDDDGHVKPIDGWAIASGGNGTTSIPDTSYGWANGLSPVGATYASLGLRVEDGEQNQVTEAANTAVNNSGYTFAQIVQTSEPDSSSYPTLLDFRVPDQADADSVDFTDSRWDALTGAYYHPLIRVSHNGKTWIASETLGRFVVRKGFASQSKGSSLQNWWGQGTLVNESDNSEQLEFVALMNGVYLNVDDNGLASDFTVFGLDASNRLPTATAGSTYRIYTSYSILNDALNPVMEFDATTIATYGLDNMSYNRVCYGEWTNDGLCASKFIAYEFTVPDISGDLGVYVGGLDTNGNVVTTSAKFTIPVSKSSSRSKVTARLYDQFGDAIRGSLNSSGEFSTGYLNALASSSEGGNIVNYRFDMGDGTILDDSTPIGTYTYTENGQYQMSLTVTDNQGHSDTTYRKVVISNTGTLIVRNVGSKILSAFVAIDNLTEPDGYYDIYKFIYMDPREEYSWELAGGNQYQINIIRNSEVVYSKTVYLVNAEEQLIEIDLDDM